MCSAALGAALHLADSRHRMKMKNEKTTAQPVIWSKALRFKVSAPAMLNCEEFSSNNCSTDRLIKVQDVFITLWP